MADLTVLDYIRSRYVSFYSVNTNPIALLVDTLIASDEARFASLACKQSRIKWVHLPDTAVPHIVFGASPAPGGQWAFSDNNSSVLHPDEKDQQSLSYAEMLSLPGYSFTEFFLTANTNQIDDYVRPCRGDISRYYAAYPHQLGLENVFQSSTVVTSVDSVINDSGERIFRVDYLHLKDPTVRLTIQTPVVVLASGVFEKPLKELRKNSIHQRPVSPGIMPTRLLPPQGVSREDLEADISSREPAVLVPQCVPSDGPSPAVLVIGSGVSAAEAVARCGQTSNVIHAFQWSNANPSPLRRLARESYPEYARILKLMKRAVKAQREALAQPTTSPHDTGLDQVAITMRQPLDDGNKPHSWYLGVANALVQSVSPCGRVTLLLPGEMGNRTITANVSKIKICTGRSGSLEYLGPSVRRLAGLRSVNADLGSISKTFLETHAREFSKDEVSDDDSLSICSNDLPDCCPPSPKPGAASSPGTSCHLRLGHGLYAIGSLTGETLVRFMLGGCMWVAHDINLNRARSKELLAI